MNTDDDKNNEKIKFLCKTISQALLSSEKIKNKVKELTREEIYDIVGISIYFELSLLIFTIQNHNDYIKNLEEDDETFQINISENTPESEQVFSNKTEDLIRTIAGSILTSKKVRETILNSTKKDLELMHEQNIFINMGAVLISIYKELLGSMMDPKQSGKNPDPLFDDYDKEWLKKNNIDPNKTGHKW